MAEMELTGHFESDREFSLNSPNLYIVRLTDV
jgi:hypothetical protein